MSTDETAFIVPEYNSLLRSDILYILLQVKSDIIKLTIDDSKREDTRVVCRALLVSIFTIIETAFDIIAKRKKLELDILSRSLVEYVIDLAYLVANNNSQLNRRFYNYYKFMKYWQSKHFTSEEYKKEVPTIESQYREYIKKEFGEDIKSELKKKEVIRLSGLHITEKKNKLCLALSLEQSKITDESIRDLSSIVFERSINDSDEDYSVELDFYIKRRFSKSWSGLNSNQRIEAIKKIVGDNPLIDVLGRYFSFYSGKVHPTPYGLSNFDPRMGAISYNAWVADSALEEVESFLVVWFHMSVIEFIKTLPPGDRDKIHNRFYALLNSSKHIKKVFFDFKAKTK